MPTGVTIPGKTLLADLEDALETHMNRIWEYGGQGELFGALDKLLSTAKDLNEAISASILYKERK